MSFLRRLHRYFSGPAAVQGEAHVAAKPAAVAASAADVADYWTRHNVTQHHAFASPDESLAYFRWRGDQYYGYMDLMPVRGQDGKVVLDYGCGPGHDLVGFATHSRPARLIGCDVSSSSLAEAKRRLALHGADCELLRLDPAQARLPLADESVDLVHCSGVLHHTHDPLAILREFRRVLRSGATAQIMVYNYESIWLHYYVAYQKMVEEQRFADLDIRTAFAKTTDGEDCPIANVYRAAEFVALARSADFEAKFTGAALSVWEASLFASRFKAIMDRRLREESRIFLAGLKVNAMGLPLHEGHYAGVDGCYLLTRA